MLERPVSSLEVSRSDLIHTLLDHTGRSPADTKAIHNNILWEANPSGSHPAQPPSCLSISREDSTTSLHVIRVSPSSLKIPRTSGAAPPLPTPPPVLLEATKRGL